MTNFKVQKHQVSNDEVIRKYNEFMAQYAARERGGIKPRTISQIKACKGVKAHMIHSACFAWGEVIKNPHSSWREVEKARKHLNSLRRVLRKMPNAAASKVHLRIHRMIDGILYQKIKNGCSVDKLPRRFVFKRDPENPANIIISSFGEVSDLKSNDKGNCILYRIDENFKKSKKERS